MTIELKGKAMKAVTLHAAANSIAELEMRKSRNLRPFLLPQSYNESLGFNCALSSQAPILCDIHEIVVNNIYGFMYSLHKITDIKIRCRNDLLLIHHYCIDL